MLSDRQTLLDIWRWLPLFRAVAETESVTRAAQAFGVSPPAVSRSLQQIEARVGQRLFDRSGRRVSLNPHGFALLDSLRDAEARIAQVLADIGDRDTAGHVRLATVGQLGRAFLVPAMKTLLERHIRLQAEIIHLEPSVALDRLASGTLDVFLGHNVSVGEPLIAARIADLRIGIYAGPGHPLHGRKDVGAEEIAAHPFAAQSRPGLMRSIWPSKIKRRVNLETDSHAVALEACLNGSHLMAMERLIARPFVAGDRLTEINTTLIPPAVLTLCRHAEKGKSAIIAAVSKAITTTVKSTLRAHPHAA